MNKSASGETNDLLLELPKWKVGYVMAVIYLLYLMDMATRTAISPMFPTLQKDLGLTDTQLGFLTSLVLVMIAVFALPVSYVIDRWRRGKLISLMSITWSIGSLVSGFSGNFAQLAVGRAVLGVGEASFVSGGMCMIIATIKKHVRATVQGIWSTASPVGMAVGIMAGGWMAVNYGWRATFVALAVPGIILGILAWFFPDYKNKTPDATAFSGTKAPSFAGTLKILLKNKTLVYMNISFGLYGLTMQAMTYWLPTYLTRYCSMNMTQASTIIGLMVLAGIVAMPLGGFITDRISKHNPRNKVIFCCICIFLAVVFFLTGTLFLIYPLFFFGLFFTCLFQPANMIAFQEVVPTNLRASAYGVFFLSQYLLGGFWGPGLAGLFSDMWGLSTALIIIEVFCLICPLGYLMALRYFDHDHNNAVEKTLISASAL